jgi:hypothetical protein
VGPVLGTLVATLATGAWYLPVLMRRTFQSSPFALVRAACAPVGWSLPFLAGAWFVARAHVPPLGLVGVAAEMGIAALAYLGFSYAAVLTPPERADLKNRLSLLIGRRA